MKHLAAGFETKKKKKKRIEVIYLKTIKSSAVNFYERKIFDRNLFVKPTGAVQVPKTQKRKRGGRKKDDFDAFY